MSRTAKSYLHDPARKRAYNRSLFSVVAPRYDVATRVLSFWRDRAWKRAMIAMAPAQVSGCAVDLASGTGDIARLCAARYPDASVVATDLSHDMLKHTPPTARTAAIHPVISDMCRAPLPDGCASLVTGSYALRNAPDLDGVLHETSRLLAPGGTALFLDFSKPAHRLLQRFELLLLWTWGELWSLLLHRRRGVYSYIADSLDTFPDRRALRHRLAEHDLEATRSRLFFFGVIEVVVCRRTHGARAETAVDSTPASTALPHCGHAAPCERYERCGNEQSW
ncbi:MAG: methyltransferase domain-containing protein [Chitinivibrionales bacterium]|nr:methyltransferase domain-containing protein [Chitinivibrionales bacterium]